MKRLLQPSHLLTFANIAGAGASFLLSWALARLLFAADFASTQFALNEYGIFLSISLLGINDGGFKYALEAQNLDEKVKRLRLVLGTTLIGSIGVAAVLTILAATGLISPQNDINRLLIFMCLTIPLANFSTATQAAFRTLGQLRKLAVHQTVMRTLATAIVLLGAFAAGIAGVGWTFALAQIAIFTFSYFLLPQELRKGWRFSLAVLPHSLVAFFWSVSVTTNMRLDLVMIEKLLGSSLATASYSLASVFALSFFSLGWSLVSRVSAALTEEHKDLSQLRRKMFSLQIKISSTCFIWSLAIAIFFEFLFPFFFGARYEGAKIFLWPLLLYTNLAIGSVVAYYALFIFGHGLYNVKVMLAALLLNLGLTYFFIHQFGLPGAPYGKVIAEVFVILCSLRFYRSQLDLRSHASQSHQ